MNNRKLHTETGSAAVVVIIGVALILVAVVGLLVFSKKSDKPAAQQSSTSESVAHSEQGISRNVQRKNDAASLAGGVAEFLNNNLAQFPTSWQAGKLSGAQGTTEVDARLYSYTAVEFASGEQPALQQDTLRLVTHASCVSGGGTANATSQTAFAVQYSQLTDAGQVRAGCVDG